MDNYISYGKTIPQKIEANITKLQTIQTCKITIIHSNVVTE